MSRTFGFDSYCTIEWKECTVYEGVHAAAEVCDSKEARAFSSIEQG